MKAGVLALLLTSGCTIVPPPVPQDVPRAQLVVPSMQARCVAFCRIIIQVTNAEGGAATAAAVPITLHSPPIDKAQ